MAYLNDSLRSAIEAQSNLAFGRDGLIGIQFGHQLAIAAYMASGMLRKVIAIPADDRTREWRDWQADKEQIELIEAEERRLDLRAKVNEAETLRGVGGGALILVTAGDHAQELKPEQIAKGGLIAVNVVSRWQITGKDWIKELTDPNYRHPRMWAVTGNKSETLIHPSRVITFRGKPMPAGAAISDEEVFWGDSQLLRVFSAVARSDDAQSWFATLIKKAKLLRIGIPDLLDMVATEEGQKQLNARVQLIAQGENSLNATVYRSGTGTDDPGEKLDDYQVNWTGIPDIMDAFDQRVAAISDIPFTRLMGRSPAGMNATGEHDGQNWNKMVAAGQNNHLRPCLEQLDAVMLRGLGLAPDKITWRFAPLDTPSESEEATTFNTTMDAVVKLQNTATFPDRALSEVVQNLLREREWLPGTDQALDAIPEAERFPEGPTEEEIRAEERAAALAKGGDQNLPAGLNDAAPRPLYVQRKLLNGADLIKWAKAQGFETTLPAEDMHVTVLYSRTAVDPMKMGEGWSSDSDGGLVVKAGGPRAVERLGENAVVLLFASWSIVSRHNEMVEAGGSHDYPEYQPHVTLSYTVPAGVDLEAIKPYAGELRFGPEIFEPLDLDWKSKITEDGGSRTSGLPFDDRIYRRDRNGRFARSNGSALSITNFLSGALKTPGDHASLEIGIAGGKSPTQVHGYARRIHAGTAHHALKDHGSRKREAARGQLPLTRSDIAKVPQIVDGAHSVQVHGTGAKGRAQSISYTARIGKREYTYVETVGTKRQQVVFKTMWKK